MQLPQGPLGPLWMRSRRFVTHRLLAVVALAKRCAHAKQPLPMIMYLLDVHQCLIHSLPGAADSMRNLLFHTSNLLFRMRNLLCCMYQYIGTSSLLPG